MQHSNLTVRTKWDTEVKKIDYQTKDFRLLLETYNLDYSFKDEYLQVGETIEEEHWILYISVVILDLIPLIESIFPILVAEKVPFRIVKDQETAKKIVDGDFGVMKLGKIICIYPEQGPQLLNITKTLISSTSSFRGPAIPYHRLLGGCLYTQDDRYANLKLKWPFEEISPYKLPNKKPLWNYRYKPLFVIKPDLKGRVIQANYFKSLFNIKLCIIKEGIKNMWCDDSGRDIVDRLKWQYQLYKDLAGHVPTPGIFDIFEENGNTYLTMEFITGESLNEKVALINKGSSWFELSIEERSLLTGYLQEIVRLVDQLHKKGYVHRDITPANFIIDKKGSIFLIDMELAYSIFLDKPNPPFKLGTDGYMSPEQMAGHNPTIKEDVYALGALMIFIFTGLPPIKFSLRQKDELVTSLDFFIESRQLINLIINCLSNKPENRPSLSDISGVLRTFTLEISAHSNSEQHKNKIENRTDSQLIDTVIQKAIRTFSLPEILTKEGLWTFPKEEYVPLISQAGSRQIFISFENGIAGIIFLLSRAHRLGYEIESCISAFRTNLEFIKGQYQNNSPITKHGLFNGSAGVALALNEAMISGLEVDDIQGIIQSCFSPVQHHGIDMATGIAGIGTALLGCHQNLDPTFFNSQLEEITNNILLRQQKNGYWENFRINNRKKDNLIGFANGTAGILCFLLASLQYHRNEQSIASIEKGLRWLIKIAEKRNGNYLWPISTKSKTIDNISYAIGLPGIALAFIKAFQFFNASAYKTVAENILYPLVKYPIDKDFTQLNGLSGLGEIYLEAHHTFKSEHWRERANYIAQLFSRTCLLSGKTSVYWSIDATTEYDSSLMTGCSGIIHFLIRMQMKNSNVNHPLLNY